MSSTSTEISPAPGKDHKAKDALSEFTEWAESKSNDPFLLVQAKGTEDDGIYGFTRLEGGRKTPEMNTKLGSVYETVKSSPSCVDANGTVKWSEVGKCADSIRTNFESNFSRKSKETKKGGGEEEVAKSEAATSSGAEKKEVDGTLKSEISKSETGKNSQGGDTATGSNAGDTLRVNTTTDWEKFKSIADSHKIKFYRFKPDEVSKVSSSKASTTTPVDNGDPSQSETRGKTEGTPSQATTVGTMGGKTKVGQTKATEGSTQRDPERDSNHSSNGSKEGSKGSNRSKESGSKKSSNPPGSDVSSSKSS